MSPLSHNQARLWIEQAADGLLGAGQQVELAAHLATCAECQAFANQLATLEGALRSSLQGYLGAAALSPSAIDQLVLKLQSGGAGGGASSGGWLQTKPWLTLGAIGVVLFILALLAGWFGGGLPNAEPPSPTPTVQEAGSATNDTTATPSRMASVTPTATPAELILVAVPVQNVNCRLGNSSQFDIADTLFADEEYTPNARGFDNLWVRFRGPVTEVQCWVYVENLDLLINDQPTPIEEISEGLLPFAAYPPTPTPTSTHTLTPEPSNTSAPTPTCTPRPQTTGGPNC